MNVVQTYFEIQLSKTFFLRLKQDAIINFKDQHTKQQETYIKCNR